MEKDENNEVVTIKVLSFFLGILAILFAVSHCIWQIEDDFVIETTGNIDIFEITLVDPARIGCNKCDCGCYENGLENCRCNEESSSGESGETSGVVVYDKDVVYAFNTPLNIFTNSTYYIFDGKIAPGSKNSYEFYIKNNNEFDIKYNLEMSEENHHNINMRYRLKLNDEYVIGDENTYVEAHELLQEEILLAANKFDRYVLDWMWFESSNDTEIGTNIEASYKLNLKISASQI